MPETSGDPFRRSRQPRMLARGIAIGFAALAVLTTGCGPPNGSRDQSTSDGSPRVRPTVAPQHPEAPTPVRRHRRPEHRHPRAPKHLALGASGPAVAALQRRLVALGYWVGPVTRRFDDATQQAVIALQKVARISRDGVVGPRTRAVLRRGSRPRPRSRSGHVVEVNRRSAHVRHRWLSDPHPQHVHRRWLLIHRRRRYGGCHHAPGTLHDLPAGRRLGNGPARPALAAEVLLRRLRDPRRRLRPGPPRFPRLCPGEQRSHRLDPGPRSVAAWRRGLDLPGRALLRCRIE